VLCPSPEAAAAFFAAAASISGDVGAARAIKTGFSGGRAFGEAPRTTRPGTESSEPDGGPAPGLFPFGSGPAENFAGLEPSGSGPASFSAGFSPTIATFTLADGRAPALRTGASWITGVLDVPFVPCAAVGAGGGTKDFGLG